MIILLRIKYFRKSGSDLKAEPPSKVEFKQFFSCRIPAVSVRDNIEIRGGCIFWPLKTKNLKSIGWMFHISGKEKYPTRSTSLIQHWNTIIEIKMVNIVIYKTSDEILNNIYNCLFIYIWILGLYFVYVKRLFYLGKKVVIVLRICIHEKENN